MSSLNLYLVTFNCGRALIKPDAFATYLFNALPDTASRSQPPDLIALHLQEIAPIAEAFNGSALPKYYDSFKGAVQLAVKQQYPTYGSSNEDAYVDFSTSRAGMTAIMIFIRADLLHNISDVTIADVGVGLQRLGNKGAVGVRIEWSLNDDTSESKETMNLTFVSAHLAPAEDKVERRNQDFLDIVAGLVFEPKPQTTTSQSSEEEPLLSTDTTNTTTPKGIYSADTHLFFAGDLNYRTSNTSPKHDGSDTAFFPKLTADPSAPNHWSSLLPRDQLTSQLHAHKTLHGLTESPIHFPPTYKYSAEACNTKDVILDADLPDWKWASHRWPSWCDRILYAQPSSQSTRVAVAKYTALPLLSTSDHRPVALSASVPLRPVSNPDLASSQPVELDRDHKSKRDVARWKEYAVGTVWGSVSTAHGLVNLTLGIAAVVCVAVLTGVYFREW